jgi:hypothetical protein
MTGIAPNVSGMYSNRQKMREILPAAELLPKYFSNHGWHLGEKQHWQKYTAWRLCTRVPLIIRVPKGAPGLMAGTQAGQTCNQPVNLLSLYRTLTDLAGLPSKVDNDGPSLVPLLRSPDASWLHTSVTYLEEKGSYGMSTEGWRYIHNAKGGEELYDTTTDRYEWNNLAEQSQYADKLAEMRKRAPKEFAARIEASVESLPALKWHALSSAADPYPASKPDGNSFKVHWVNDRKETVQTFRVDPQGEIEPYGTVAPGKTKFQKTQPGDVWLITDEQDNPLGYFKIDDRTARGKIP